MRADVARTMRCPAGHPAGMLRVTYAYHGHHSGCIFDWATLSAKLTAAGFADVRRYDAGQSDDLEFKALETRAEPAEAATGPIAEAQQPGRYPRWPLSSCGA